MNKYIWDLRYLKLAEHMSTWSKDSTGIGSVAIGDQGQVLAQGYNGFPRGVEDSQERYDVKEDKYKFVVHSEMNVIYNASYNGVSLRDSTLYVWGLPVCSECAKGIIQTGIKRVVMSNRDRISTLPLSDKWRESFDLTKTLFEEAGVEWEFV
ncbi:MAG TPA: CMP deaminase [Saprospirales bacterium]|nr:CMP deaminase [Saprospirales bacterium]